MQYDLINNPNGFIFYLILSLSPKFPIYSHNEILLANFFFILQYKKLKDLREWNLFFFFFQFSLFVLSFLDNFI